MSDTRVGLHKFDGIDGPHVTCADREIVFIRGDPGDCAYVVVSGTVQIREAGRVIETMQPGELFGEMALIDSDPRSASAVAVGPVELVVVDRAEFERLLQDEPGFALKVMRLMSRRLRATIAAAVPPTGDFPLGVPPQKAG